MSDLTPPASSSGPPDEGNPYVIEHYGFATTPVALEPAPSAVPDGAPVGHLRTRDTRHRPRMRHRGVLVAAATSLALVAGAGGFAAAATQSGPDGRGADRPGSTFVVGRDVGGPGGRPGGIGAREADRGPDGDRGPR